MSWSLRGVLVVLLCILAGLACRHHTTPGGDASQIGAGERQSITEPAPAHSNQPLDLLPQYLETLQATQAAPSELAAAVAGLARLPIKAPPGFWVDIVNNPAYDEDRRREAIVQLFLRHFPPGKRIGSISKLPGTSGWFSTNNIFSCTVASHLPIEDRGECAFMYQPAVMAPNQTRNYRSGGYVILSLPAYISVKDLVLVLGGKRSDDGTEIVELAASPGDPVAKPQ